MHVRAFAAGRKWSGPVLAALGLGAVAMITLPAMKIPYAGWMFSNVLAPERVLPLIGLGVACGLVNARVFCATLVLFGLGIVGGTVEQDQLISVLSNARWGPTHLFLTGPISSVASGLALAPGVFFLPWLLPIAALIVGAMLSLAIKLTDPSLHEPIFTWTPLLAAVWIVMAVALSLRAFSRSWYPILGRILGSWLIAVGLLYGGAEIARRLNPPPTPTDTSPESTRGAERQTTNPDVPPPEFNREIPGLPQSEQPEILPGGLSRPPPP